MSLSERLSLYQPQALAALRIMTALQFIEHGTQKFFNFPPAAEPFGDLMNLIGVAGRLEIVGGLVLVGLFTRPVAFVLCGFWRWPISWRTCRWTSGRSTTAATRRSRSASSSSISVAGPGAFALDNGEALPPPSQDANFRPDDAGDDQGDAAEAERRDRFGKQHDAEDDGADRADAGPDGIGRCRSADERTASPRSTMLTSPSQPRVSAVGSGRVKPSVYLRPIAQPISKRPASVREVSRTCLLRLKGARPSPRS
jgi:putative oxidoreductase